MSLKMFLWVMYIINNIFRLNRRKGETCLHYDEVRHSFPREFCLLFDKYAPKKVVRNLDLDLPSHLQILVNNPSNGSLS